MDQLEKIRRHYWKEHLKMVLSEQGYSFTKLRKFTYVCMAGGPNLPPPPPTIQTSAKFLEFE